MKIFLCLAIALNVLIQTGCRKDAQEIEFISISYPSGETDLRIWESGEARLYYGARPQSKNIRKRMFNIESLYEQLVPRLYPNVPRENWPNPNARYGMVQVQFKGEGAITYLIFHEEELTNALFAKARRNIVGRNSL